MKTIVDPDRITAELTDAERSRFNAIGPVIEHLRPSMGNAVAGFVLGAAAFGGGGFGFLVVFRALKESGGNLPFWAERGWSWGAIILAIILAIVAVGVGVILVWFARNIARRHIYICELGFWYSSGSKVRVFPWNDITLVRETVLYEKLPLVKGPARNLMPTKKSSSYMVKRVDGETFNLTASDTSSFKDLAALLRTSAEKRQIPWEVVERRG